jgi:hypothetical protein
VHVSAVQAWNTSSCEKLAQGRSETTGASPAAAWRERRGGGAEAAPPWAVGPRAVLYGKPLLLTRSGEYVKVGRGWGSSWARERAEEGREGEAPAEAIGTHRDNSSPGAFIGIFAPSVS